MSPWPITAVAIIRIIMTLAPLRGLLNRDFDEFGFAGAFRREADELLGATNARIVLYSWPLLTFAAIVTRTHELSRNLAPIWVLVLVGALLMMLVLIRLVPARKLRGTVRATVVALGSIVADVVFSLYVDSVVDLVAAP